MSKKKYVGFAHGSPKERTGGVEESGGEEEEKERMKGRRE